ncbi:MAG: hypothetical protein E7602_08250 [Ruminococcaceae bacterium]|nr:hypothetical protein [Oscillospiraceae bacterium]
MNEQITEQTNNSAGVPGTGAESGAGTSTAVASSVATENSSADNINGAIDTEPKDGEGNAQKEGAEEKVPKQDKAKNAEMARKRRERELEEARRQARFEGIKSVLKENPYTKKPIEDDADIEEYLLMQEIAKDGKDPVADYSEYAKKRAREKASSQARKEAVNDKITKELEEFATVHPGVNVNDVLDDKMFKSFADGKLGKKSLADVYREYLPLKEAMTAARREAEKNVHADAVAAAAVGSVTNSSAPPEGEFFTKEQVLKMSPSEISKNYEKIRKSQGKW